MRGQGLLSKGTRKRLAATGILFVFILLLMPAHGSAWQKKETRSSQLKVIVTGMENDTGSIRIALFDSEDSYKAAKKPLRTASVKIRNKRTEALFDNLPYGTYAIRLYHDVNENGKLDKDGRSLPLEPYAFSNNAQGTMGPAAWADARFAVQSKYTKMEITLD